MVTQAQQRPQYTDKQAQDMLEQVLANTSMRSRVLRNYFDDNVAKIEEVLPAGMKGQGRRLAKRAEMTMARKPDMVECPAADLIRIVIEAAEIGLAIDGKLCHAVPYKGKWQCQPDYKGLIAVARRSGQIKDAYARIVRENDKFEHGQDGGDCILKHSYRLTDKRGDVIGAYAIVTLPSDGWRYELIDRAELDVFQEFAPSKKGPWGGPWIDEMRKKSVIRRALKTYCDDPAFVRAMELADQEYEDDPPPERTRAHSFPDRPRQNGNGDGVPVAPPDTLGDLAGDRGRETNGHSDASTEEPREEPEAPEPPAPPEPQSAELTPEEAALYDAEDTLRERLTEYKSQAAFDAIGADLKTLEARYGPKGYAKLLKVFQNSYNRWLASQQLKPATNGGGKRRASEV